jgi:chromosome segregation ATPase
MSRSSDTRQRTREAAAQLVASGKRPHEITVDLIYAAIQQGSRTTINDALKAWRDERTKADAIGADLPPALVDSMRSLWVSAVEHGERVFEARSDALENQVAGERARADAAEQRWADVQAALQHATADGAAEKQTHAQTRAELANTRDAAAIAQTRAADLEQQLVQLREQAANEQAALQEAMAQQAAEYRETLSSRDRGYQAEIEKATVRLESAQDHMLQNVDAAREAQKRAESQLAKLQQRYDALQAEHTEQRIKLGEQARELQQHAAHRLQQETEIKQLREESHRLAVDLASVRGQLTAATTQIAAAEDRARSAEARLDRSLADSRALPAKKTAVKGKGTGDHRD